MKIEVIEIKENEDGSAEYIFEVDEDMRASIMKATGMKKRWNKKKFEQFVLAAIDARLKNGGV